MTNSDRVTKAWRVVGRNSNGNLVQLGRRFHSKAAADTLAELSKNQGYTDVVVRTVTGYDKIT